MLRKNTQLVLLVTWILAGTLALAGCASSPEAQDSGGQPAEDAAATESVQDSSAEAADAQPEEPPAPTQEERRTELALAFGRTWHTTITTNPDDEFSWSGIESWYDDCVAFVAPGSTLLGQFEGSAAGSFMGPGTSDSPTVAIDVELVSVEGDSYTVRVAYATANEFVAGWREQTVDANETYTFDASDKIVRIQTEYADWG